MNTMDIMDTTDTLDTSVMDKVPFFSTENASTKKIHQ